MNAVVVFLAEVIKKDMEEVPAEERVFMLAVGKLVEKANRFIANPTKKNAYDFAALADKVLWADASYRKRMSAAGRSPSEAHVSLMRHAWPMMREMFNIVGEHWPMPCNLVIKMTEVD